MPDLFGGTSCQCADLPVGPAQSILCVDGGLSFPRWGCFYYLLLLLYSLTFTLYTYHIDFYILYIYILHIQYTFLVFTVYCILNLIIYYTFLVYTLTLIVYCIVNLIFQYTFLVYTVTLNVYCILNLIIQYTFTIIYYYILLVNCSQTTAFLSPIFSSYPL